MTIQYLAFIRLPTEKAHGLQIMKTCEALARARAEVELVVPGRQSPIGDDSFRYYGVQKNFTLTALGTPDWVRFGKLGFLASLVWFAEVAKWRSSYLKADIVYSRDAVMLLQYIFLGRHLVYEAHQAPTWASRFVARRAHRVVAISHALADAYAKAGVARDKILVAPDAVDEHLFDRVRDRVDARRALDPHLSTDQKIVLYAGSLHPRKGAETLAEAARLLPGVIVICAGVVTPTRAAFWGTSSVRLLGQVPHNKVVECMRAADVLVIPNSARDADTAAYGSPMKLFEYMASGTPIVASRVRAITDILPDDAAFFANPDDPEDLARAIKEALASPDAPLSAARAKELAKRYSWEARAARILDGLQAV